MGSLAGGFRSTSGRRSKRRPLRRATAAVLLSLCAVAFLGLAAAPARAASAPTLAVGDSGAAVTHLQRVLASLHYFVGHVDGEFGPTTMHAVVAFQKVSGLGRDGVVGPLTWAALNDPTRPTPAGNTERLAVEVDLTRQVLFLERQGEVRRIFDVSTGSGERYFNEGSWHTAVTPTGSFSLQRRIDDWHESSLGMMYRPNYFYGGYAIHGSESVPPYPASHGCVRVTVAAMDKLWDALRIGMAVSVYRS
jgi:Putative peptidoglycan binding domain/L,D-transpeptidase catalytic domain